MLILILIVACIVILLIYLVVTVRRHDKRAYADQDRDPFHSEMSRLTAAGLLYEQEERKFGRPRKSYIVTPAGEAALRTWLREPMNDPGLLRLYFAGIVAPSDVVNLAREQKQQHCERLEQYDRIDSLFGRKKGWDEGRDLAALGRRFEEFCVDFWAKQIEEPLRGPTEDDEGADTEEEEKEKETDDA
ncbi:hypothetical protein [uncultured Algimonas sp.]|uniref:hypothetical protein n=1 Tax=uncultured Algimonas sp. TaxID=1547920 RepID=UPI0026347166|nr:hypothetical protein [uncultured Algimonas sp.]